MASCKYKKFALGDKQLKQSRYELWDSLLPKNWNKFYALVPSQYKDKTGFKVSAWPYILDTYFDNFGGFSGGFVFSNKKKIKNCGVGYFQDSFGFYNYQEYIIETCFSRAKNYIKQVIQEITDPEDIFIILKNYFANGQFFIVETGFGKTVLKFWRTAFIYNLSLLLNDHSNPLIFNSKNGNLIGAFGFIEKNALLMENVVEEAKEFLQSYVFSLFYVIGGANLTDKWKNEYGKFILQKQEEGRPLFVIMSYNKVTAFGKFLTNKDTNFSKDYDEKVEHAMQQQVDNNKYAVRVKAQTSTLANGQKYSVKVNPSREDIKILYENGYIDFKNVGDFRIKPLVENKKTLDPWFWMICFVTLNFDESPEVKNDCIKQQIFAAKAARNFIHPLLKQRILAWSYCCLANNPVNNALINYQNQIKVLNTGNKFAASRYWHGTGGRPPRVDNNNNKDSNKNLKYEKKSKKKIPEIMLPKNAKKFKELFHDRHVIMFNQKIGDKLKEQGILQVDKIKPPSTQFEKHINLFQNELFAKLYTLACFTTSKIIETKTTKAISKEEDENEDSDDEEEKTEEQQSQVQKLSQYIMCNMGNLMDFLLHPALLFGYPSDLDDPNYRTTLYYQPMQLLQDIGAYSDYAENCDDDLEIEKQFVLDLASFDFAARKKKETKQKKKDDDNNNDEEDDEIEYETAENNLMNKAILEIKNYSSIPISKWILLSIFKVLGVDILKDDLFDYEKPSLMMEAVLDQVEESMKNGKKMVLFCERKDFLYMLYAHLKEKHGSQSIFAFFNEKGLDKIKTFNNSAKQKICLASANNGQGYSLWSCDEVYIIGENSKSGEITRQNIDRVVRPVPKRCEHLVKKDRNISIYHFSFPKSIHEFYRSLNDKKAFFVDCLMDPDSEDFMNIQHLQSRNEQNYLLFNQFVKLDIKNSKSALSQLYQGVVDQEKLDAITNIIETTVNFDNLLDVAQDFCNAFENAFGEAISSANTFKINRTKLESFDVESDDEKQPFDSFNNNNNNMEQTKNENENQDDEWIKKKTRKQEKKQTKSVNKKRKVVDLTFLDNEKPKKKFKKKKNSAPIEIETDDADEALNFFEEAALSENESPQEKQSQENNLFADINPNLFDDLF